LRESCDKSFNSNVAENCSAAFSNSSEESSTAVAVATAAAGSYDTGTVAAIPNAFARNTVHDAATAAETANCDSGFGHAITEPETLVSTVVENAEIFTPDAPATATKTAADALVLCGVCLFHLRPLLCLYSCHCI
jgi:hypothetical protein